jgi:hypothetical protein
MPRTFHVHAQAALMPELAALQQAIKALKFNLTVDEGYVPFETAGYLPCTLEGEDAGVDMRFERDVPGTDGRDALMKLKWSGDPREHLSALILAAAMVHAFGAQVLDPDKGVPVPEAELLKKAKALLEDSF